MIRYVVALPAEARPLIRHLDLIRAPAGEPPIWRGPGVSLVVSGIGRAAAAAAVESLARLDDAAESGVGGAGGFPDEAAWINVGVGGHRDLPLGEVVLADRVVDAAAAGQRSPEAHLPRAWCPPLVFEPPCATATVTTVDRPETRYPEDTVYDMEAAGFCAAAARRASAELIQVIKVISDNTAAPPARLTALRVEELIAGRLDTIAAIAAETAAHARELAARRRPSGRQ